MNPSKLICGILLPVLAGLSGYLLGAGRNQTGRAALLNRTVAAELFHAADSFSEIKLTRARLTALADQYALLAQEWIVRDFAASRSSPRWDGGDENSNVSAAVRLLEEVVEELRDTGEDLRLLPLLLHALKREGLLDRWLEWYLGTLYAHPTHPVVNSLVEQAVAIGRAAGREAEVAAAFRHLQNIPARFGGPAPIPSRLAGLDAACRGAG